VLIVNIIGTAYQHGRMPSDVWLEYQRRPSDLHYLWMHGRWLDYKREQARKDQK
jgi:hypothetical protein